MAIPPARERVRQPACFHRVLEGNTGAGLFASPARGDVSTLEYPSTRSHDGANGISAIAELVTADLIVVGARVGCH
jgi:hypothetical protein